MPAAGYPTGRWRVLCCCVLRRGGGEDRRTPAADTILDRSLDDTMDSSPTRRSGADKAPATVQASAEEMLVADDRAGLRPSELVERKLLGLLKKNAIPVSQVVAGRRVLRSR